MRFYFINCFTKHVSLWIKPNKLLFLYNFCSTNSQIISTTSSSIRTCIASIKEKLAQEPDLSSNLKLLMFMNSPALRMAKSLENSLLSLPNLTIKRIWSAFILKFKFCTKLANMITLKLFSNNSIPLWKRTHILMALRSRLPQNICGVCICLLNTILFAMKLWPLLTSTSQRPSVIPAQSHSFIWSKQQSSTNCTTTLKVWRQLTRLERWTSPIATWTTFVWSISWNVKSQISLKIFWGCSWGMMLVFMSSKIIGTSLKPGKVSWSRGSLNLDFATLISSTNSFWISKLMNWIFIFIASVSGLSVNISNSLNSTITSMMIKSMLKLLDLPSDT